MRYLLIALLLNCGCGGPRYEIDASADWEIKIYGAPEGFYVWYSGFEPTQDAEEAEPPAETGWPPKVTIDGYWSMPRFESYVFRVESLNDIKPTPGEMED